MKPKECSYDTAPHKNNFKKAGYAAVASLLLTACSMTATNPPPFGQENGSNPFSQATVLPPKGWVTPTSSWIIQEDPPIKSPGMGEGYPTLPPPPNNEGPGEIQVTVEPMPTLEPPKAHQENEGSVIPEPPRDAKLIEQCKQWLELNNLVDQGEKLSRSQGNTFFELTGKFEEVMGPYLHMFEGGSSNNETYDRFVSILTNPSFAKEFAPWNIAAEYRKADDEYITYAMQLPENPTEEEKQQLEELKAVVDGTQSYLLKGTMEFYCAGIQLENSKPEGGN